MTLGQKILRRLAKTRWYYIWGGLVTVALLIIVLAKGAC